MRSLGAVIPALLLLAATGCSRQAAAVPVEEAEAPPAATSPAKPQAALDSYSTQVRPFVQKYCVQCHGEKKQSGGLNLAAFASTDAVVKDREAWETVKQRLEMKEMPPKKQTQPAADEVKKVVAWIDTELTRAAQAAPMTAGRVTMRRLNRTEYNRTVHDLTGVKFQPADDFPTDDVGNGFDNIGDVLSLPPLLLEKYLNAAENVVQHIFEDDPAPPVVTKVEAKNLQTTATKTQMLTIGNAQVRQMDEAADIFTTYKAPRPGEFVFRVRLSVLHQDKVGSRAQVSMRVDDKEVKLWVANLQPNSRTTIEAKTTVTAGPHRLSVTLVNPSDDKTPPAERRAVRVAFFEMLDPPEPPKKPDGYARVMVGSGETRDRARQIVATFAKKAYRRPVTAIEINRLMKLYDMAKQAEPFERAVGIALQAVLVSPHFLFRVETDRTPDRPDGSYPLNDWEIASRLSYFLWSTMPDDELFRLAQAGQLHEPATLEAQVRRMLKDEKSAALVENFGGQWLNLRNLQTAQPAKRDFPLWDEQLRSAMRKETELFFAAVIREDRSILDFLDADFTYLNGRLARHYEIPGVEGPEFRRVTLTDRSRGGVLTQASVLTVTSNPTRTSPVKRGKWILENILGTPPPPPPPDVPELKEDKETVLKGSLRERMEQHRANPNCATCHERMDPLGFGFENFDAIGGWRTKDGSFKIDPSGVLPGGQKFSGPAELKKVLLAKEEQFRRCLTEKLLTYALGRGVEAADRPAVEKIAKAVAADRNRFNRMVLEIVESDPFLRRTAKR
ncbi:MAG: DUF1592 domain-containing protein [Gemmataceae bacterium]